MNITQRLERPFLGLFTPLEGFSFILGAYLDVDLVLHVKVVQVGVVNEDVDFQSRLWDALNNTPRVHPPDLLQYEQSLAREQKCIVPWLSIEPFSRVIAHRVHGIVLPSIANVFNGHGFTIPSHKGVRSQSALELLHHSIICSFIDTFRGLVLRIVILGSPWGLVLVHFAQELPLRVKSRLCIGLLTANYTHLHYLTPTFVSKSLI